jgi:hypothetical protein
MWCHCWLAALAFSRQSRGDDGRDDPPTLFTGIGKDITHEVRAAALLSEIAAGPQLGDVQFNRAGPRLLGAIAIAVALGTAFGALLAIAGAGQRADFHLHQPLAAS